MQVSENIESVQEVGACLGVDGVIVRKIKSLVVMEGETPMEYIFTYDLVF